MTLVELPAKMPGALLLISELVLLWSIASYAVESDPIQEANRGSAEQPSVGRLWTLVLVLRSLVVGIITIVFAGAGLGSVVLALLLALGCILLPIARCWWIPPAYGAELEILACIFPLSSIVICVLHWRLIALHHWTSLPFSEARSSSLCLIAAIVIFNLRGGTYVVRGLLNKCGALPELQVPKDSTVTPRPARVMAEKIVDAVEINRGRWIGNLERLLTLAIVAEGSYSALAFLIAAKGFIRSRDLENREWAEYFLLGTLASITASVAGGLLIRLIIRALW